MDGPGEWTIIHIIYYCICACDGPYDAHANSYYTPSNKESSPRNVMSM